ncbi:MAG TPA: hypothetical protein VGR06_19930 [Actinophytocola sp.]|uniref:hypothetical protein n=1 Tax=Actinophytocola sp. TaxID=1872138 RepID=UPI002DFC38BF|nr:hypothetical protein [Actinophytocola sp.]
MTDPEDLPSRVTRLEDEVKRAREDSAVARYLAAEADRDVADVRLELKAHTSTLKALRDTQIEQGQEMRAGFAKVNDRFAEVNGKFAEVNESLAMLGAGMARIHTALKIDPAGET